MEPISLDKPRNLLKKLMENVPCAPVKANIPHASGIYALRDHKGIVRYFGIAANLNDRIASKHVSGAENSHKFTSVYNTGRLWHLSSHEQSDGADGKLAKQLRSIFARRFCSVTYIVIAKSKAELECLERSVKLLAKPENRRWNDTKSYRESEPIHLVDELLDELQWSDESKEAIRRQDIRFRGLRALSTASPYLHHCEQAM